MMTNAATSPIDSAGPEQLEQVTGIPTSRKQQRDRARVRVKYDLPPALKEAIEAAARAPEVDTSASQFAAFLLAWAMKAYQDADTTLQEAVSNARGTARTLRFSNNLEIPPQWLEELV